jgi:hypothetical protein
MTARQRRGPGLADRDTLDEALEAFKLASEAEADNRAAFVEDVEFARIGGEHQWTVGGVNWAAKRAGRPTLTINMLPQFQRQVMNDIRQNRPAIKVRPVDSGADIKTADVFTGLIRNIEQQSHADTVWDTAADNAIAGGFGYATVTVEYSCDDTFDQDIRLKRVANPLTIYGDPYSTEADSSDWNNAFQTEIIDKATFAKRFPGADGVNWDDADHKLLEAPWHKGDEVMVALWWRREKVQRKILRLSDGTVIAEEDFVRKFEDGSSKQAVAQIAGITVVAERMAPSMKVTNTLMTGADVLERNPWPGRYIPIIPVYGEEVVLDGKRIFKSLIRDAKDAQCNFNFWRSAATELIALAPKAPFIGKEGAFDIDERWATANSENHPFLEYKGDEMPQRQPFAGIPAGALNQAMLANDDIKASLGMYNASLGAKSNETSGRAIMARQREGDVATFHFADNLNRAIRHAGVIMLDLIPKVYSGQRMVRILGEDGKAQTVQIGPKPMGPPAQMQMPPPQMPGPGAQMQMPPQIGGM